MKYQNEFAKAFKFDLFTSPDDYWELCVRYDELYTGFCKGMDTALEKAPICNKVHTQTILEAFKNGEVLTANTVQDRLGIGHFSQRLSDIKRLGCTVKDEWRKYKGKRYKAYWIEQSEFYKGLQGVEN